MLPNILAVTLTALLLLAVNSVLAAVPRLSHGKGFAGPVHLPLQQHTVPLSDAGRYFTAPAIVDTRDGIQQKFSLLVDISRCRSFVRSTLCTSPDDYFSCTGPKWNINGLTEDTHAGPYSYAGITDFNTLVHFNSYFATMTVGGFTARNMSLGGSTDSHNWYPYFGDGVLALCNPALFVDLFPSFLNVQWFYWLGLNGDADRFAIFLPKYRGGNFGELTVGGSNSARYKGSIQW
ncbi:hypothetical protein HDU76_007870, partial [Blyttiomyces sp. JEL0837]